jgi:hypothetical protein
MRAAAAPAQAQEIATRALGLKEPAMMDAVQAAAAPATACPATALLLRRAAGGHIRAVAHTHAAAVVVAAAAARDRIDPAK